MGQKRVIGCCLAALASCASVASERTTTQAPQFSAGAADEAKPAPGAVQTRPSAPAVAFEPRRGWYVLAQAQLADVSGSDFEGDTLVTGGGSSEAVPDPGHGLGFGAGLGWRFETSALELSFAQLDHDGRFVGADFDTQVENYALEWRHFIGDHRRLEPHWLIGLGYGRLIVRDGSAGLGQVGDAEFSGASLNVGGGATYHLTPHVGIGLDLGYRWQRYVEVDGVVSGDLEDALTAHVLYSTLRLQLTL